MLRKPASAIALLLLIVVAVSAIGQTLMIEGPDTETSQSIPIRGMTMEFVEANFGSPTSKRSPVGDPPITRWEYQNFIVYFEYKRVLHSVSKRSISN